MHAQLHVNDISFSYGAEPLVEHVTFTVAPNARIGLVGPNGCGKSTLLGLLCGQLTPSSGRLSRVPTNATVGLMSQVRATEPDEIVEELIARQTGVLDAQQRIDQAATDIAAEAAGAADAYDRALDQWLRLGGPDLDARTNVVLESLGVSPEDLRGRQVSSLSGGERAKVWLAAVMLARFDILLLDEPTNDLDLEGLAELENTLLARTDGLVLVSHDRRLLERVVTDVLDVDLDPRGGSRTSVRHFGGGWQAYLESKETAVRQARAQFDEYTDKRDRLSDRAATERRWSSKGVAAERRPPDNDRAARGARIERSEQLAARARRTERAIDRLEVVDKPWEPWRLEFDIGEVERSGDLVAQLDAAIVDRGDFRLGPVNLIVDVADRILLEGPNGAGKTTLVDALLGRIGLSSGTQRLGPSVVIGELDQGRAGLATEGRLVDRVSEATQLSAGEVRSTLAKFGLSSTHVDRPTAELSPGEQTRAVLAVFQAKGVNTLVLDEPTNHLDLLAIEQLEQALDRFGGTLLVISHDRAFIDGVRFTRRLRVEKGRVTEM